MTPRKNKTNFKKALFFLLFMLGIAGYAFYASMVANPSINVANGLEAEEAAFLQKSINTDKKRSVGTAPAPVIKVTDVVTRPKKDNPEEEETIEVTGTVILNNTAAKTVTEAKATIVDQLVKTGIPTKVGISVGVSGTADSELSASGTISNGTCSTNGSPVLEGTWVSTGKANSDVRDGVAGRQCVKCGSKGYEGNMDCRDVVAQGLPFVLPTGGGMNYIGTNEKISSCFADIGGGAYVQVGVGQATKNKGKDGFCSPTGNIVYDTTTLTSEMQSMCSSIGKVASNGKCENPGSSNTTNPDANDPFRNVCSKTGAEVQSDGITWLYCGKQGEAATEIKCSTAAGLAVDANGKCRAVTSGVTCKEGLQDFGGRMAYVTCDSRGSQMYNFCSGGGEYISGYGGYGCAEQGVGKVVNPKGVYTGGESVKPGEESKCKYGSIGGKCNYSTGNPNAKPPLVDNATHPPNPVTENLTTDQKNQLNDPTKPWAENNPVLVKKESDCPEDSNIDTVYLPNDTGPTYRCKPTQSSIEPSDTSSDNFLDPTGPWEKIVNAVGQIGNIFNFKPVGEAVVQDINNPNTVAVKLLEDSCKKTSECATGLFCEKRAFAVDRCTEVSKRTLKSKDECYTYFVGKDQLCGNCPDGYILNEILNTYSMYRCK